MDLSESVKVNIRQDFKQLFEGIHAGRGSVGSANVTTTVAGISTPVAGTSTNTGVALEILPSSNCLGDLSLFATADWILKYTTSARTTFS